MKRLVFLLVLIAGCDSGRQCRKCAWLEDGPQCVRIVENGVVWSVSRGAYPSEDEITWEAEPHCSKCGHHLSSGFKPDEECAYCGDAVVCDKKTRGEIIVKAKDQTPRPMIELWKSLR